MKAKIRIGPHDTVGGVVTELGRVYREARRGQLPLGVGTRLATMLRELRTAMETSDLERRLKDLEAEV